MERLDLTAKFFVEQFHYISAQIVLKNHIA